ncbi:MAG TPA: hypothetical protein VK778_08805 [Solirubrobacteraceae bacterium]|nr:hypothetical protein [Solirubrobacteraceae bacterium]
MSDGPGLPLPADHQQAELVECLRAAAGEPVSFEELRARGIENPAVLCYELELVGMSIDRVRQAVTTRAVESVPAPESSAPGRMRYGAPGRMRYRTSLVALVLPALALAVGATLALTGGTHTAAAGKHSALAASAARRPPPRAARPKQASPPAKQASPPAKQARPRVSAAAAAKLQAEGHQLLAEGHYTAAIGELRGALAATGESLASCATPSTEACLTYAYALYDLGRALLFDGEPKAAVGVLGERLRIDNQRSVVEEELQLAARAHAHGAGVDTAGTGTGGTPPRG